MKKRLDVQLMEQGLAKSRSQARLLIKEGYVYQRGQQLLKPSQICPEDGLEIRKGTQYVGRGGEKLEGALDAFEIDPSGMVVADIGASTGGFTDCLLKRGAIKAYCIDVGHEQLDPKLVRDRRVINMEGHNIRDGASLEQQVDLAVVDLSYISLRLVLDPIFKLLSPCGIVVALVKPQFEAGKDNIGKKGVIRDAQLRAFVLEELHDWCMGNGHLVKDAIRSPIEGKTGNIEYFFLLTSDSNVTFPKEQLKDL